MDQQNQGADKLTVNQLFELVEQLSPEEYVEFCRKLDCSWKERWDSITSRVRNRAKSLPPISDEDIIAEVKVVRDARKGLGY